MVECIYSTIRDENRESQAFAFSKKASICLNPTWFQGSYLLWLGYILEPHFMAFESGAGLGKYNGCIPTIPNARESEPYTLYCHQYYTVHTIKYHTVNIHLRHSAGSNLHINPTWKWIHEIWPFKGESLIFLKKIAQKWPKIMAYFQILYRKLGPHLFLSHHIVWSNVFLKKQGSPLAARNSA